MEHLEEAKAKPSTQPAQAAHRMPVKHEQSKLEMHEEASHHEGVSSKIKKESKRIKLMVTKGEMCGGSDKLGDWD